MTKKLSQEFSRTESRFLGALSRLDEFLLHTQARIHSGFLSETTQVSNRENQGTNEDRSQNDPQPEVGVSLSQYSQNLGPKETSDKKNISLAAKTPKTRSEKPKYYVIRERYRKLVIVLYLCCCCKQLVFFNRISQRQKTRQSFSRKLEIVTFVFPFDSNNPVESRKMMRCTRKNIYTQTGAI